MKKIQVTYFFEDSGFCKDVFKEIYAELGINHLMTR